MGMRVKISEWGNSLAVRLPKALAEQLGLKAGDEADVTVNGQTASLTAVADSSVRRRHDQLIAEARKLLAAGASAPEPVDWGDDRGGEVIEDAYSVNSGDA